MTLSAVTSYNRCGWNCFLLCVELPVFLYVWNGARLGHAPIVTAYPDSFRNDHPISFDQGKVARDCRTISMIRDISVALSVYGSHVNRISFGSLLLLLLFFYFVCVFRTNSDAFQKTCASGMFATIAELFLLHAHRNFPTWPVKCSRTIECLSSPVAGQSLCPNDCIICVATNAPISEEYAAPHSSNLLISGRVSRFAIAPGKRFSCSRSGMESFSKNFVYVRLHMYLHEVTGTS